MADPAFLPQLRALAETGADYFALKALAACGDAKLAGELAIKNVEQTLVTKEDAPSASISIRTVGSVRRGEGTAWRMVYDQINLLAGTVKFMGETGNPEYVAKIEPFTREGRVEELRTALASAAKASGEEPYTFAVDELNRVAILALARAGGATAIARLKEIYDKGDIKQRVASAMALHSLGDETATELIQLFIEHRERENVEIAKRYRIDMTDDFHRAASYLCSERTNAVLIERLKSGFEDNDDNLSEAFLKGHASFLLPILAQNLSHHDETVRYAAFHLLKRILPDVETDYDPNKPARWQVETINRLRQRALDG
ncbi:MAG: hypothetical protein HYV26_24085 [Candidatus Hydrogenedentes bacterium]|nr:hypothetical protein [Candidatus Hydrogenedentota bacterium]